SDPRPRDTACPTPHVATVSSDPPSARCVRILFANSSTPTEREPGRRRRRPDLTRPMRRLLTSIGIAALVISACGGDESGEPAPSLSPEADVGRRLVQTNGCAACHGSSGGGGVGPPLAGAYGREVRLEDGTTTIADEEYLRRSIREPGA